MALFWDRRGGRVRRWQGGFSGKWLAWVEHVGAVKRELMLRVDACAGIGVYGADHAISKTGAWCGAVEEYRIRVVDGQGGLWRVVEDFVDGMEACEEAGFVGARHFVGNAREAVFRADDTVVCRVESEFNSLGYG